MFSKIQAAIIGLLLFPPLAYGASYLVSYEELLERYTAQGTRAGIETVLVDYQGWGKDAHHAQAMANLQQVNPESLTDKAQKIAFWTNAYNLLTVDLIIRTGERESIKNQGTLLRNVWKSHQWQIHGKDYTLDQIEHEILRPLGDARIHMAIVCASLSCPDLLNAPYRSETLDQQLHQASLRFLRNPKKGAEQIDGTLQISKIFKWFAADFGGEEGVDKFIAAHAPEMNLQDKKRAYHDYHWGLNAQ